MHFPPELGELIQSLAGSGAKQGMKAPVQFPHLLNAFGTILKDLTIVPKKLFLKDLILLVRSHLIP